MKHRREREEGRNDERVLVLSYVSPQCFMKVTHRACVKPITCWICSGGWTCA